MNHLSAHLRRSGSHDGLPFHAQCPACTRERLRGTPNAGPLLPASARAGLTAVVIAASAAVGATRSADPARAQTEGSPADEAPQMVSPEELDKQLADPNDPPPKADSQGKADAQAGALKGGSYVVQPGDSLWRIARAKIGGSPTNARLAAEVDRLWALNSVKVGTGNPDLIYAGQRIKLR